MLALPGRDHGLVTFLDARKICGLEANFKSFDDLQAIFSNANVELLKETYESVEDIDLIVGGALETFANQDTALVGDTFGCIISEQYRRASAGDAYFYSHQTNPYPFTAAQLKAIDDYGVSQLICQNSNLSSVLKVWFFMESEENPKVLCSDLKPFDFSAWSQI